MHGTCGFCVSMVGYRSLLLLLVGRIIQPAHMYIICRSARSRQTDQADRECMLHASCNERLFNNTSCMRGLLRQIIGQCHTRRACSGTRIRFSNLSGLSKTQRNPCCVVLVATHPQPITERLLYCCSAHCIEESNCNKRRLRTILCHWAVPSPSLLLS
jgi:hypothetical protein